MAEERKGLVTWGGIPMTLAGTAKKVGDKAPDFTVVDQKRQPVEFSSSAGKVRLISVVPSLDTGICDAQTRRFNEEAAKLGDMVEIWTLSVDLPFAQKRWCGAAGIDKVKVYSDHRDLSFGMSYGLVMKEQRILARSILLVDNDDTIRYIEIVPEISTHPNYDTAIEALKKML